MNIDLTALLDIQRINLNNAIQTAISANEVNIIDINKTEQLDKGIGSEGQDFGQYKNFKYKGRFTPVDLKLKNDFRSAEDLEITNNDVKMIDNDFKLPFLTKRYGPILGWTDQNVDKIGRIIENDVKQNIETQLS